VASVLPHVKTGRLRMLAVCGAKRSPLLPDVPTLAESGVPGYESVAYFAIFAPAGTPPEIVKRLNADLVKIVHAPQVKARLLELGADPVGSTPEALAATVRAERAKWAGVIKEANVKTE
jgi:tripartite-type tricarboxylate transporter receptor subunit TctC